jgi:proteasome lid subunit RPN8/RPN11
MTSTSTYSEPRKPETATPPPPQPTIPAEVQNLPERQPPLSDKCWLHGKKGGQGQVWLIAHRAALSQIDEHAHSNLQSELGGALLGKAYRYQKIVFVEVMAAIPVVSNDRGPIHFTFSADAWPKIQQDRNEHYPDLEIVGWFHTHPGLGVFYSSDDVVVHSAAFTLPWHVGLVVDPIHKEAAFFGWEQGSLAPLSGFYELIEEQAGQPAVDWRAVETAVWHHRHEEEFYNEDRLSSHQPSSTSTPVTALSNVTILAIAVAIMGLVLSLALLLGWVWPLRQQVNNLEGVTLLLAEQVVENTAVCPNPAIRVLTPINGSQATIGDNVTFVGTATHADTNRFQLAVRPINVGAEWTLVNELRRDVSFGRLGLWDTTENRAATYEVRLTAVNRDNTILATAPVCTIEIELTN